MIKWVEGDLMIVGSGVYEGHAFVPGRGVNQLINLKEGKLIFGTSLIQVHEVHADTPLPTFLLCLDGVRQPFWELYLPNDVGL